MRKIETIKKYIERAQARIAKAEAALPRLATRRDNAIAKLAKAGYTYVGDGNDGSRCPWELWSTTYTATESIEGIERRNKEIKADKAALERLNAELAQAEDKINSIPQALKDYQVKLEHSLITDGKMRRDWAKAEIEERKENGEWVTSEDYHEARSNYYRNPDDEAVRAALHRVEDARSEQDKLTAASRQSDESIAKESKDIAAALVQDLAARVAHYVGEATDCSGLHITTGTHGYSVLNGIVVGADGRRCEVKSQGVAGYNIIRWHIRVTVSPVRS